MHSKFTFSSSVREDVSRPKEKQESYEWWYFDALSDNGNEAVAITFLDNFIFSPRYNAECRRSIRSTLAGAADPEEPASFPAIAFVYYRDGKAIYRVINEYPASELETSPTSPECRIGNNSFSFTSAPYGTGYSVSIDTKLDRNTRITANFEWLSIESDFTANEEPSGRGFHHWNMVSPRSDVTGKITLIKKNGKTSNEINFRGTGYHDHNSDDRWLPNTIKSWQRGRIHFPDCTAVYFRYQELGSEESITNLFIARDGKLFTYNAISTAQTFSRNIFGVKYPERLQITSDDNIRLRIKQNTLVDSSLFYLRFLSEMTLSMNHGKPRKGIGISEHLSPKALRYKWLDWLMRLRVSK
ncbi:MAG: hypothetical protein KDB79_02820 [Acidobacteria bacterium]|nr:hypothetical protein [Acidobacteriota bacterium]